MTSPHTHARGLALGSTVTLAAVSILSISGCAVRAGSGDSSDDARRSLYSTLDDTQNLLGGIWDNQDDPTPRGCVIPLWSEGELYPALRIGQAHPHAEDAVRAVSTYWNGIGLSVSSTDVGDVIEMQGESEFGEVVILRVSAEATTLQGESECRPEE